MGDMPPDARLDYMAAKVTPLIKANKGMWDKMLAVEEMITEACISMTWRLAESRHRDTSGTWYDETADSLRYAALPRPPHAPCTRNIDATL